ncbi:replication initiator protein A [Fodinicurvata sp. EGI_FJ10296]|uniref:replication initiator protein A n=1 Tax=Fodinicurvata sp. EGI_FJ10296 TaxID=3231908 RepID=UPI003455D82A
MVGDSTKDRPPLLPDRMRQADFFVCDIFDAAPKGDMASMQNPVFSISTKPDRNVRRYENGENFVEVTPSVKGLATVHDRDVLIFCISQVMAAINDGRNDDIRPTLRFKAYDLLKATNRGTDGRGYEQLRAALERLSGTRITTNITTGNVEVLDGFGLIDRFRIIRETRDGRMHDIEVTLSEWVFNAINAREVLTLHRNYFRLRKPLERRLYEIARKHCGNSSEWRIGLHKLKSKCGSYSTDKEFRRLLSNIIIEDTAHAHIPDYSVTLDGEMVIFQSRGSVPVRREEVFNGRLDPECFHDARTAAPGWDIYYLEREWRRWLGENEIVAKNPERHFVKFCRSWFEKRGKPS